VKNPIATGLTTLIVQFA